LTDLEDQYEKWNDEEGEEIYTITQEQKRAARNPAVWAVWDSIDEQFPLPKK
jgi:hypothetical protein